jgi:hypothetical protein
MIKKPKEEVRTSVMVDAENFKQFKAACARDKFTLTGLVNNCVELYLKDPDFRKIMRNYQFYQTPEVEV